MTEITLDNLSKVFGRGTAATAAVDRVSLRIVPGEFFFLLGPSGCGKTTLLRMIAGLIAPSDGRVRFGDRDVTDLPIEQRRTPMVFQSYALWPHMTVQANVEFGPRRAGHSRSESRRLAIEALRRVQMESFGDRKPPQLSGGQQQRVALARALAVEGQCLLLDEPLSNLDARLRLHMRGELRRLVKATGATAVYVTHDQKEALSMADRIAVMNAGRIVQVGPPEALYNRPATRFVADFLGEANFLNGTVAAVDSQTAAVRTAVGEIFASPELPESLGQQVTVCIRPERLALSVGAEGGEAGLNRIQAVVVSSTYLGELRQYVCRLNDGTNWRVSALADIAAPAREGQAVTLTADPQAVCLLKE